MMLVENDETFFVQLGSSDMLSISRSALLLSPVTDDDCKIWIDATNMLMMLNILSSLQWSLENTSYMDAVL